MNFDIFVWRFENGVPATLDMSAAHEVLDPHAVVWDPETDFLLVSTAEGEEASVYFSNPTGITFNRFGGDGIMDLLAVLLQRLDAVLVVPGGVTVLQRNEDRELLPASLSDEWPVPERRSPGRSGLLERTGLSLHAAAVAGQYGSGVGARPGCSPLHRTTGWRRHGSCHSGARVDRVTSECLPVLEVRNAALDPDPA
ncbi:hypothetical protein ACODT5_36615 [Streptomyces sp. 5.8]|uniref:hypothetical protein n=1 Tax=Streptomyces sp. 5.8 TaxID=3406571 RepID=UPI003BB6A432